MKTGEQDKLRFEINTLLNQLLIVDIHTHIYDPALGSLLLWGIDELLTYHYLVAEVFRACPGMGYDEFWAMPKSKQADLIWCELFIKRSPISEACRGVLTVLSKLGLDVNNEQLGEFREYYKQFDARSYTDKVFELAGIKQVYMTNDPLDPQEGPKWQTGFERDMRFLAVLRLDSALKRWPEPVPQLQAMGYEVDFRLSETTISSIRRYIDDWCDKLDARYMAISLPPDFRYPDESSSLTTLMTNAVFKTARARKIPLAMMIGMRKRVNPYLNDAGDSVGKSDLTTVENIASEFNDVKFLISTPSRENIHELCVVARKFKNIVPFGCWWFLNNPSLIKEVTTMRLEMLGLSFVPQHSDARVLDQLIYKWAHSREVIAEILAEKYSDIQRCGLDVTEENIARDLAIMFDGRLIQ